MHEKFMKKALKLAEKGAGYTNPNPMVGALIVKDGKIIGEGYHQKYGEAHAEVNALKNATEDVEGATMYVTLEPCSHYGKTPPCAKTIVEHGIGAVVIASEDPNPLVSGGGVKMLKAAGIDVTTGILDAENKVLNEIFFNYIRTKRPFVILKTAMSADGKIATRTNESKWISNEKSRQFVHKLRHRVAAIMVGANTVFHDDPLLTSRVRDQTTQNPIRIILDTDGRTPLTSRLLSDKAARTIIVTTNKVKAETLKAFKEKGAEVLVTPLKNGNVDLTHLMGTLGEMGIDSILLEGGAYVNDSAMREGLIDKYYSFIAPKLIGGENAPTPIGGIGFAAIEETITLRRIDVRTFDEDLLIIYERGDRHVHRNH